MPGPPPGRPAAWADPLGPVLLERRTGTARVVPSGYDGATEGQERFLETVWFPGPHGREVVMFVGHLGVGLALASRSPRFRLGTLLGAAMLLDALLGVFVLAGMEQVIVPPSFGNARYLEFVFPYSHGLLNSMLWAGITAALAGAGWLLIGRGAAAAWIAGAAVFSHFLCDAVVHVRGLPLLGEDSPHLALGLWKAIPWALALELLLLVGGAALYLRSRPGLSPPRRGVLLGVLGLLTILQLGGQLGGGMPPPAPVLAVSWIAQTAALVLLGLWVDPVRVTAPAVAAPGG